MKFAVLLLIIGLNAALLVGCKSHKKTVNDPDKVLELQFVPTNNDGSMEAKTKPFARYLSKKLNRKVNVTLATDYSTIVEAMSSKKVDIGIMPPSAYVQARMQNVATAILSSKLGAYNRQTGKPEINQLSSTFKGEILVRSNSKIKKLKDLKGKKIAALSPNSASGYIYPIVDLKDAGINPEKNLTITTINDIPSEMTAVLNGQQDACFVFEGARNVFSKKFVNQDLFKELRVLHLTKGSIPNDAIAVHPKMNKKLREKIKKAFMDMSKDPQGQKAMAMWGHKGYVTANDKNYSDVEEYTQKAAE
ncbi:phosphate/phosphite/phosphonate ABC transporter substrate-binding protein [Melissococcus plutonius]|nr:phosphate/phosphite/phosphonate ABC transporter substrate-binding protein [Melissococcus plutonius]MCV2498399.1 phosphate/phosphite/phosphonate ABC transporter substrate-binding protein [Melissococcus plutonius]MCV2500386.1 phosphate/phosphite/phosphonate ABC transporter substrate-binding protein [Melissococcus plutonius]MCV2504490.1 phosphate/phosphite/phosphonate ABC transporter substrate-binding protein [Melissococcus plutonius]MCV2507014.1 phosphate/phosphite/phosphonate ABC transporter 